MTPDQQCRAAKAVRSRMSELRMSVPQLARAAGVDPTTVRGFVRGGRWPATRTRDKLCAALGWTPGEITRQAVSDGTDLSGVSTIDLATELARRARKAAQNEAG